MKTRKQECRTCGLPDGSCEPALHGAVLRVKAWQLSKLLLGMEPVSIGAKRITPRKAIDERPEISKRTDPKPDW